MLDAFRTCARDFNACSVAQQQLKAFEAAADEAVVVIGMAHLGMA